MTYDVRKCRGHWHVTTDQSVPDWDDLAIPGDPFPTETAARAAMAQLEARDAGLPPAPARVLEPAPALREPRVFEAALVLGIVSLLAMGLRATDAPWPFHMLVWIQTIVWIKRLCA